MNARPLIVDLVRAYEGLLLGLVFVVVPGALMVAFMHQGTPSRPVFLARATGAILGWVLVWLLFGPLHIAAYFVGFPVAGEMGLLAFLEFIDGVLVGLGLVFAERVRRRLGRQAPRSAGGGRSGPQET